MPAISVEKRIAILSGRIDRAAWLQLQRFRHHPNFAKLLEHLEGSDGAVREADVQRAVRIFLDNYDKKS
jgi:hypothetical protein